MKRVSASQSICAIALILYVTLVLSILLVKSHTNSSGSVIFSSVSVLLIILLVYLFKRFYGSVSGILVGSAASKKEYIFWFAVAFTVSLSILLVYYVAFFPGAFSQDSYVQFLQAKTGIYNDWHPFMHTLLFFTLPLKLSGGRVGAIVLMQIICFSASFGYLTATLRRNKCSCLLCAVEILFIMLSPITGNIMMFPWKDCAFAIFAMVVTAQYVNSICSKGTWLEKPINLICFIAFSALAVLMRHNAILFIFPILVVLAVLCRSKKRLVAGMLAGFLGLLIIVKGPVYSIYKVEKPDRRIVETTGMCMVIMGGAVTEEPDRLPEHIRDFLYSVSPQEVWEEEYKSGDFNYVKWDEQTNVYVIENLGVEKLLKYTLETIKSCPKSSLKAFLNVTGMVWNPPGESRWDIAAISINADSTTKYISENMRNACYSMVTNWRHTVKYGVLKNVFYFIGTLNLMLIACCLVRVKRWSDMLKAVHSLPILCYNFGTALLLTGFDFRFFYYTYPVFLPFIFLILRRENKETN